MFVGISKYLFRDQPLQSKTSLLDPYPLQSLPSPQTLDLGYARILHSGYMAARLHTSASSFE